MVENKNGRRETISEARDSGDMDQKVAFPIPLSIPAPSTNLARAFIFIYFFFSCGMWDLVP